MSVWLRYNLKLKMLHKHMCVTSSVHTKPSVHCKYLDLVQCAFI